MGEIMNKLKFVFSAIVFSAGLVITTLAQAETIKIGVSFRMLSDVGYKHGELITDTVAKWNKAVSYTHLTLPTKQPV